MNEYREQIARLVDGLERYEEGVHVSFYVSNENLPELLSFLYKAEQGDSNE